LKYLLGILFIFVSAHASATYSEADLPEEISKQLMPKILPIVSKYNKQADEFGWRKILVTQSNNELQIVYPAGGKNSLICISNNMGASCLVQDFGEINRLNSTISIQDGVSGLIWDLLPVEPDSVYGLKRYKNIKCHRSSYGTYSCTVHGAILKR
jgi:hypothetical protein